MKDMMEEGVLHQDKPLCSGMALQGQQDIVSLAQEGQGTINSCWHETINGRLTPDFYSVHVQPQYPACHLFLPQRSLAISSDMARTPTPEVYMRPYLHS